MKKPLFSTAYLGSIEYFANLVRHKNIFIDVGEHYIKQTYRNRCVIYAANGKLPQIIPVVKVNGNHTKTKDIKIDYSGRWQKNHWRSIVSAYNQSPFFLYYKDDLETIFEKKFDFLIDFNTELTKIILNFIEAETTIHLSEDYIDSTEPETIDFRNSFSPKKPPTLSHPSYIQVFSEKYGFIPNLSIIDLLFNEGPNTLDYLLDL